MIVDSLQDVQRLQGRCLRESLMNNCSIHTCPFELVALVKLRRGRDKGNLVESLMGHIKQWAQRRALPLYIPSIEAAW